MQVDRICPGCGARFSTSASRLKWGRGKYCSRKCQYANQVINHWVFTKCAVCGEEIKRSPSHIKSRNQFCSPECSYKGRATKLVTRPPPTTKTRQKMSEAQRGERGPNWQGGISNKPYCPKFNNEFRRRVRAFFEYRCVLCGKPEDANKTKLCVHHVEYNKQACCDGKPAMFAALCSRCHCRTNVNRARWESMMHRIIDEIWNGKSYYTSEEI